ncbi:MAG TPA: LamG-like jellyroll fold domain-containing protein [Flavobacterium sp.]|nr:LamG-like jellyroll fold domain-containing protein [Flavobacterium sp.]
MKKNAKNTFLAMSAMALILAGCSSDDNDGTPDLPPIGGYDNSDEVAAANLVAKWSFENDLKDSKNNIAGVGTLAGYSVGKKGQAFQGSSTEARYAIYNGETAVGAVSSFSLAFWMKAGQTVPDGGTPGQGKGAQGIFSLVNPDGFWGGLNLFLENPDDNNPTKLRIKMDIENKRTGVVWQGQGPIFNVASIDTWVHIVLTYDAATSRFSAYQNGELGAVNSLSGVPYGLFGTTASNILYGNDPGGPGPVGDYPTDPAATPGSNGNPNSAPLYGALEFATPALSQVVIGSHQFTTTPSLTTVHGTEPWSTTYAGALDEFRIYKSALTLAEVNALFLLESANR